MKNTDLAITAAAALVAWSFFKYRDGPLGWWRDLVAPGSQQARQLAGQEAAFYNSAMGYSQQPAPIVWI